jgi:type II secretory pathway component PulF
LNAGVDLLTILQRETPRARTLEAKKHWKEVLHQVRRGASLEEALARSPDFFPELFREMTAVGSESGYLGETLLEVADYYDYMTRLKRSFLASLIWPAIELAIALGVIGVFIVAMGIIEGITGTRVDPLGLGLVGISGLLIYLAILTTVVGSFVGLYVLARKSAGTRLSVQHLLLRLPVLGKAIRNLAMARITWAMYLTFQTGMDVSRAVTIALRASLLAPFSRAAEEVNREIAKGESLSIAFRRAEVFDDDFLDMLFMSEEAGRIPEAMKHLSGEYSSRARTSLQGMAVLGFFLALFAVGGIIIFAIFRIAWFYFQQIYDLLDAI